MRFPPKGGMVSNGQQLEARVGAFARLGRSLLDGASKPANYQGLFVLKLCGSIAVGNAGSDARRELGVEPVPGEVPGRRLVAVSHEMGLGNDAGTGDANWRISGTKNAFHHPNTELAAIPERAASAGSFAMHHCECRGTAVPWRVHCEIFSSVGRK